MSIIEQEREKQRKKAAWEQRQAAKGNQKKSRDSHATMEVLKASMLGKVLGNLGAPKQSDAHNSSVDSKTSKTGSLGNLLLKLKADKEKKEAAQASAGMRGQQILNSSGVKIGVSNQTSNEVSNDSSPKLKAKRKRTKNDPSDYEKFVRALSNEGEGAVKTATEVADNLRKMKDKAKQNYLMYKQGLSD